MKITNVTFQPNFGKTFKANLKSVCNKKKEELASDYSLITISLKKCKVWYLIFYAARLKVTGCKNHDSCNFETIKTRILVKKMYLKVSYSLISSDFL